MQGIVRHSSDRGIPLRTDGSLLPGRTASDPTPYREAGFCAVGKISGWTPTTFGVPQISVKPGSSVYPATSPSKVNSHHPYYVPWALEAGLADYVFTSSLSSQLSGESAVLTHISGTKCACPTARRCRIVWFWVWERWRVLTSWILSDSLTEKAWERLLQSRSFVA